MGVETIEDNPKFMFGVKKQYLINLPFGLPGGLSARIALLPTFLIGLNIQSRSPPND